MKEYYSIRYLETKILNSKSMIYSSILKHGYSSFSLEILEYCDGDQAISREQYYLDLLNPEYNILKKAGSRLGSKHSSEAIAKMKNRILTVEQKAKHREHLARLNLRSEQKEHLKRLNLSQKGRARMLRMQKEQENQIFL
jgi:group I intron endonuclease